MKALRLLHFLLLFLSFSGYSHAQESFPVNGPRDSRHNHHVFLHVNIVQSPGNVLENATLIIRDERILSIGTGLEIPKNSIIHDMKGKWIYPSFIELDSDYGIGGKANNSTGKGYKGPQYESNKKGAYNWNEAIHPEVDASTNFHVDKNKAASYRNLGFGAALSHRHDGIMRGTSAMVHLGDESDNLMMIQEKAAFHFSFSKGSSRQNYPSSQMGAIALIRQTLYDAQWYVSAREIEETNMSLQALIDNENLPVIFESTDYLSSLRADKIADEFDQQYIIRGAGDEYKRVVDIKNTEATFIIPLKLPLPYNVSSSFESIDLSLTKMKQWELAPFNARYLYENGVEFAFTSRGAKGDEVWKNLRRISKTGLNEEVILRALTTVPAELVGVENELGKIAPGYYANFLIFSEPFLNETSILHEHWVNGKQYKVRGNEIDIRGSYNLNVNKNGGLSLKVDGDLLKPKARIEKGKDKIPVEIRLNGNEISLKYAIGDGDEKDYILLSGNINDEESRIWVGKGQLANGTWVDWAAIKQTGDKISDTSEVDTTVIDLPQVIYPLSAFGFDTLPEQKYVLIKHATIWTNEEEGIIKDADICIADGKILAVGEALSRVTLFGTKEVDLEIIDAKGKHVTSGIIDEHSHIAISRGVNEGGQASSAEVRIGDVINPDDINIYRQLAGGVTASQLLHGSANPIGGQSALIKLRWGSSAEQMKIKEADGFIKFALGENVKQSNWGDAMKIRYPQTRMGVEQVYYDGFTRAKEYGEINKIYESGLKSKKGKKNAPIPPRKDLDLEALLEILDSNRFITCHSYVQSEINMLMHVGDSMGFRVNTFTHILEGYKVADKMKAHGAGGSTFSDWWAYKYEVNDAIPYNAAILNEEGIVTAINSDDAEMGRRLNQEAAKAYKYGNVSQEEAWKMVTLNPAKLLHLDHRMGSLAKGKDADIVIWSDNPLSINAKVERTYVDGRCLFDVQADETQREWLKNERGRLIQKMIKESSKGGKSRKVKRDKNKNYHCDSVEEHYDEEL